MKNVLQQKRQSKQSFCLRRQRRCKSASSLSTDANRWCKLRRRASPGRGRALPPDASSPPPFASSLWSFSLAAWRHDAVVARLFRRLSPSAAAAPPGHCLLSQFAGLGDCGDEGRRTLGGSLSTRADHPSSPLSFPAPSLLSLFFSIQKTVTTIVPKQAPLVDLEPNQHVGEHLHTSLFLLDFSIAPSRAPFGPAPHTTTEPPWPPAAGHHQAFPGRTSPQNGTNALQ